MPTPRLPPLSCLSRLSAATACLFATACTVPQDRATPAPPPATLTIASWNMEHLAERDGSGCRPRSEADYAAMRAYAAAMDADVVALQEVESRAAAERVFDPALYTVEIEQRAGTDRKGECGGKPGLTINAQRTGFAIRKGVVFERLADFTALQVGNPDLRSGVDIVVRPAGGTPLRLLSVHLKSGCNAGNTRDACPVLFQQVPVLEDWIDRRAAEAMPFAVLGDFNRRMAMPGDAVWAEWDDASPPDADLARASGDAPTQCNPRYRDFIDFIVLDRRASQRLAGFEERRYDAQALSDHCAITARLRAR